MCGLGVKTLVHVTPALVPERHAHIVEAPKDQPQGAQPSNFEDQIVSIEGYHVAIDHAVLLGDAQGQRVAKATAAHMVAVFHDDAQPRARLQC